MNYDAHLTELVYILGVIALNLSTPVLAQSDGGRYYGPHMWDGSWGMLLGPLWMIVVVATVVVVVALLVRWLAGSGHMMGHAHPSARTPMDILRERFAKGEIDKEEFEERRRVLE